LNSGLLTPTDDQSNTLYSTRYEQTYHSTHGAVAESRHIYLQGSGVAQRLAHSHPTRVLEIGFGLGLNCLLSLDAAMSHKCRLHYVGIEHQPIDVATFHELNFAPLLQHAQLADVVSQLFEDKSRHRNATFETMGQPLTLDLHIANALDQLSEIEPEFDAIYLDAFSPDVNPECWTEPFLTALREKLASDGVMTSYCVKGGVQRALKNTGWQVAKFKGPKGKREVLRARHGPPHSIR